MDGSTRAGQLQPRELYRFYSSELSYFSAKVRPALRYKRLPFVDLLATAEVYRQVIRPRTGFNFIPILVTPDDETLQDTSDILDDIERRFPSPPLYPTTPVQRIVAYLWELYADEFLILPALHYRWSFPESETKARADFAATNGDAPQANRFADGIKAFIRMAGVLPETSAAIEAHTLELLDDLSGHFAEHGYLLGERPSLADLALIGPFYAHLYLDAVPARLLRERAPHVCHWIERLNHPDPDASGDWLANDALAPAMRSMLARIGRDAIPILLDTVRDFEAWADRQEADWSEPPRAVGMHRTSLRGVAFDRYTSPYTLWMVQRPRDAYARLDDAGRQAVDRALAGTGCEALFAEPSRHRLGKSRFRLVRVSA